jgi:ergothioneine biosynthesis protein EgtB
MGTTKSALKSSTSSTSSSELSKKYSLIRGDSERLCQPLKIEDYGCQTCPEVSPPKWHLAHTAWFFETLILKPHLRGYIEFHPLFGRLFNSYYETFGAKHPRPERGLLTRPTVAQVYEYRRYVDTAMELLMADTEHSRREDIEQLIILGLNHEQQHQELLLTDIKNIFAYNPLRPVYKESLETKMTSKTERNCEIEWIDISGRICNIGYDANDVDQHAGLGFSYDNEVPRHKVVIRDFKLASRPVNNGEFCEFINAGGYNTPDYWLSDAWKIVSSQQWHAPLYWESIDGQWWSMSLSGMRPVDVSSPVCHVSFYEAAAYARWAGKRLPTEQEWEVAASGYTIEGNFRDSGVLHPHCAVSKKPLKQLFGDVWEWTQSAYVAYPGYCQENGALGEYNGKFMSGQMVLRGGSCVTPQDHMRVTYRNFFYPHERWQFSGIRLAEDI